MTRPQVQARLHDVLAKACRDTGTPGAALGLMIAGDRYVACYGNATATDERPVDRDTRFSTGCIVKAWLAIAAMRLVDAGQLALDAAIGEVPGLRLDRDVASTITVRHLLSYSSGLDCNIQVDQSLLDDDAYGAYAALLTGDDALHAPGRAFSYGPGSYIVLAHVLECITGKPVDRLLADHVFAPAGVVHDIHESPADDPTFADGHVRVATGDIVSVPKDWRFARCYAVAHDLRGFSITEMLQLCDFALTIRSTERDRTIGDDLMWRRMCVPQVPVLHSHLTDWGIGWSIWGTESAGHNGYYLGHSANLRFSLTRDSAIVLLCNRHEALDLYERVFDELATTLLDARTVVSRPASPADDDLLCLTGRFHGADVRVDIELIAGCLRLKARLLRDRSAGLIASAALIDDTYRLPKSLDLRRLNRDVFASEETSAVTFLMRDDDGIPQLLRYGNKVLRRVA